MSFKALSCLALAVVSSAIPLTSKAESLVVSDTPTFVRPYVIQHLVGHVVSTGNTANRFPITAASSGGAFTLLTTNAGRSETISVPPHSHKRGYENFFCSKGALQLWLATDKDNQHVRLLEPGDLGASPPGRIHAFQTMRPDTELFGVTFPGGLEKMFYAGGGKSNYSTSSPYDALAVPDLGGPPRGPPRGPPPSGSPPVSPPTAPPGSGGIGALPSIMEEFDLFPVPGFVQRTDIGNGSAPVSSYWHVTSEPLPEDPTVPYYIAKDFGLKFLNSENGYTIISPLNRLPHSRPYNFTLSYLTFSIPKDVAAIPQRFFPEHGAFRVQDGALSVQVEGYGGAVQLLPGDVAFLPKDTKYKVHAIVPGTKTLYVGAGEKGLDMLLLKPAKPWNSASWPTKFE